MYNKGSKFITHPSNDNKYNRILWSLDSKFILLPWQHTKPYLLWDFISMLFELFTRVLQFILHYGSPSFAFSQWAWVYFLSHFGTAQLIGSSWFDWHQWSIISAFLFLMHFLLPLRLTSNWKVKYNRFGFLHAHWWCKTDGIRVELIKMWSKLLKDEHYDRHCFLCNNNRKYSCWFNLHSMSNIFLWCHTCSTNFDFTFYNKIVVLTINRDFCKNPDEKY